MPPRNPKFLRHDLDKSLKSLAMEDKKAGEYDKLIRKGYTYRPRDTVTQQDLINVEDDSDDCEEYVPNPSSTNNDKAVKGKEIDNKKTKVREMKHKPLPPVPANAAHPRAVEMAANSENVRAYELAAGGDILRVFELAANIENLDVMADAARHARTCRGREASVTPSLLIEEYDGDTANVSRAQIKSASSGKIGGGKAKRVIK